jgi:hypothetical protein
MLVQSDRANGWMETTPGWHHLGGEGRRTHAPSGRAGAVTERKPTAVSWRSWIEHQIEQGREGGAFDDLEGHGQPIPDLDRPHDDLWWLKAKLQREEIVVTPPSLAIRIERDAVLAAVRAAESEAEVRARINTLNDKIRVLNRSATWGPPTSVAPLDIETIVERWRADRPSPGPPTAGEFRPSDDTVSQPSKRWPLRWSLRREQ